MSLGAAELSRLSSLLDTVLDFDEAGREEWLACLEGEDALLAPTLRKLLVQQASVSTGDVLERGPAFTLAAEGDDVAASPFHANELVGPYRLERRIGEGGMGEVWLAVRDDGRLKRQVALKLPMLSARRSVLVQRFARERDILASLTHPNIARLYDAGLATDAQPYLAMEYVEGQPITDYCGGHKLDLRERVRLAQQVMSAVIYAHANLVIHRDLKPSNVLVTASGQAMLLDFGIAKMLQEDSADAVETELTQMSGRAMTLSYAAPEQIHGAPVNIATDVWALGVLLYEMLAGTRPFAGQRQALVQAILEKEPLPLRGLPSDLATVVLKALKKPPGERYATVNAFSEDLGRWLRGEPVLTQADRLGYRVRKFVVRHKVAVASASAVLVAVIAASVISVWKAREALEQTRIAKAESQTALAVQGFMEDIFRANSAAHADPVKARSTTAEELLDAAGQKLDGALSETPQARIRMLRILADVYIEMGVREKALATSKMAVETAEQTAPSSQLMVEILRLHEHALLVAGDEAKAREIRQRRVTLARGLHLTGIEMGHIEMAIADLQPADAPAHLRRALEIFRGELPNAGGRDGAALGVVSALNSLADAYSAPPFFDPKASREAALEALRTLETKAAAFPDGVYVEGYRTNVYMSLVRSSMLLDDPSEAIRYAQLSVQSAMALGQYQDSTARLRSTLLAGRLLAAARPLDAIADLDRRWHVNDPTIAEVRLPEQLPVLTSYARAQVEAGRIRGGLATLHRAEVLAGEVWNPPQTAADRARWLALVWMQLGQPDRAGREMARSMDVLRVAGLPTDLWLLVAAQVNIAGGDAGAARANVAAWQSSPSTAKTLRNRLEAACTLAEAALIDGAAVVAEAEAAGVVRSVEVYAQREALADVEARARGLRGRAALARGDLAAALSELGAAVRLLKHVVDTSVSLAYAHLLGALAQAQYRSGLVAAARASLAAMESIEERYSDLGPGLRGELLRITQEVSGKPGRPA